MDITGTNKSKEKTVCLSNPTTNSTVDGIQQFSMQEVTHHSDYDSCWLVIRDFVYDVTSFISEHPGGWEIIMERAGTDATSPFEGKGHSDDAIKRLAKYKIGQLTRSERLERG